jgi:ribose transport system substrate-binding protein
MSAHFEPCEEEDMGKSKRARSGQLFGLVALAALLASLVVTGCGGGGSSSSSSSASTTGEAETKEANSEETGSGGNFAPLEKFIAEYEKEPSAIHAKKALASKPKPGQTIVFLQCAVAQCSQQATGVKEATAAVGWKTEIANYDSADPSTLLTQMQDALAKHPVAVIFSGSPEEIWAKEIPAYEKAGVALIPMFIGPAKVEGPVIANIAGKLENEIAGKLLADWFTVNSEGKGSGVIQAVPGFPAITIWVEYFQEELGKVCPECSLEELEVSLEELGDGSSTQTTLSAMQRTGNATYAFAYNGGFIPNLPTEAQTAGLSEVNIGTYAATGDYVAEAAAGKNGAFILLSNIYAGWIAVNAALLHEEGASMTEEEALLPIQLATKESATQQLAERANSYEAPPKYKEEFEKLWGVG